MSTDREINVDLSVAEVIATYGSRYGGQGEIRRADMEDMLSRLIGGLVSEQFEEPDDEHIQMFVSVGDLSMTGYVDGLIACASFSGDVKWYVSADTVEEMHNYFVSFINGTLEPLAENGWVTSSSQLTDLPGSEFRKYPAE